METCALHFAKLKLAISPNVGNSGAQFLVVGDCVRASPFYIIKKTKKLLFSIHFLDHIFRLQVVQDFVQATEDEETTKEWLHRIMETSSRESSDYDINLLGVEQRNAQIKLS